MTTTAAQPTAAHYVVRCCDGVFRHQAPFDNLQAATDWAESGHSCHCPGGHTIEPVPEEPF